MSLSNIDGWQPWIFAVYMMVLFTLNDIEILPSYNDTYNTP